MKGFDITEQRDIDEHIKFIRIKPNNLKLTLAEIFESLSDLSWIGKFDKEYLRSSFKVRADSTLRNLEQKLLNGDNDHITSDTGETIVSELARKSVVTTLDYSDIPLAEFFKQKRDGNPGFDFFTENKSEIILFGEAKYISKSNGYTKAFDQIVGFINVGKDISDFADIRDFCSENSLDNSHSGLKGYVAAFSSTNMETDRLINNIKANENFIKLSSHKEIICVAVDVIL